MKRDKGTFLSLPSWGSNCFPPGPQADCIPVCNRASLTAYFCAYSIRYLSLDNFIQPLSGGRSCFSDSNFTFFLFVSYGYFFLDHTINLSKSKLISKLDHFDETKKYFSLIVSTQLNQLVFPWFTTRFSFQSSGLHTGHKNPVHPYHLHYLCDL